MWYFVFKNSKGNLEAVKSDNLATKYPHLIDVWKYYVRANTPEEAIQYIKDNKLDSLLENE